MVILTFTVFTIRNESGPTTRQPVVVNTVDVLGIHDHRRVHKSEDITFGKTDGMDLTYMEKHQEFGSVRTGINI